MKLSNSEARRILLSSQELTGKNGSKGHAETLRTLENLGYVQIDTLSVVARAHHHTLWTRNGNYTEADLATLLEQKKIFEYWSHAASYLPMKDFRYSLVRKQMYAQGKKHWSLQVDTKLKKHVLKRIEQEGGLQSKDFEHPPKAPGSWYTWKPAKRALEQLFMEGKLMVASRKGFQKVYDLSERVIPPGTNTSLPSEEEYCRYLIEQALQSNGLMTAAEISYLQSHTRSGVVKQIKHLLQSGSLYEVKVNDGNVYYGLKKQMDCILSAKAKTNSVHILSPFDNLLIQRKRMSAFFGFDYVIECYIPEPKRKYGYFCLPVLDGLTFVARFDPKADRKTGLFHIKQWHSEPGWKAEPAFNEAFTQKLRAFASFSGCHTLVAGKGEPASLKKLW
ncbi:MAG TPA: crosslink repair DNA glycosylase YcaQ family protein [Bacteroidia bacterium]|nr:crosslink repair DNA glycosylase YcaQ family protein [Bacteroidia bacterium]